MKKLLLSIVLLASSYHPGAETINRARAKFNYQMFCMGCHTPDGAGSRYVPKIKGHIGYFLQTQAGREYLVRVPGSANAALNDQQLAELLNWTILEFGEGSLPDAFRPYTADEVGALRQQPLMEVLKYREQLISALDAAL